MTTTNPSVPSMPHQPSTTARPPASVGQVVPARFRRRRDRGQSTAEYALVMLGAATIALAFVGWATGSGRIGSLFDQVIDTVMGGL